MRIIDLANWPRRAHFEFFKGIDYPHFNLCANVDVTTLRDATKTRGVSFNIATVYTLARAANAVPELRQRIRGGQVVEHEIVHPSTTVLSRDDLFTFCLIEYSADFTVFAARAAERIAQVREHPTLDDPPGRDDLLFLTAVPWVSFTGVMHPVHMHPVDSVPRIAWGKFFPQEDRLLMPLSLQAHHGLADGLHAGRFYAQVQALLDGPGFV
jgi:chloramphenicol O-acetyltransferase type A